MSVLVTIKTLGRLTYTPESQKTFREASLLVQELLVKMPGSATYVMIPHDKVKWKPRHGQRVCLRPSQGRGIRLRVKPGDSGSCWEYTLECGHNVDSDAVREFLEAQLGEEHFDESHEVVMPTPLSGSETAMDLLQKMMEAVQRQALRESEKAAINLKINAKDKEIAALQKEREELQFKFMEIDEAMASDPEAQKAQQLSQMMNAFVSGK